MQRWKRLLAFAVIYFVWGSTFLGIRIGVLEVPPLLFAAMRFFIAGAALFGWMMARREPIPNRREWSSIFLLAVLIFLVDYGLLFWAEQRVPSGLAAGVVGTDSFFMGLSEVMFLHTPWLKGRPAAAPAVGIAGGTLRLRRF